MRVMLDEGTMNIEHRGFIMRIMHTLLTLLTLVTLAFALCPPTLARAEPAFHYGLELGTRGPVPGGESL